MEAGHRGLPAAAALVMCGIAGIFHRDPRAAVDTERVAAMAAALTHRGPDGHGLRAGPGYCLGHRRLSIVDIAGGAQPMGTADGRLWVDYNGEIYNHLELRAELESHGHVFRTRCDTEVLLHGYRQWGDRLPEKLRGMFAFALVDEERHRLLAARDRLGKKPFHWLELGARFMFASEIKALLAHPEVPRDLDRRALVQYLALRYVPDPETAFRGIRKLAPAHALAADGGGVRTWRYWSVSFAEPDTRPESVLHEEALALLDEAVRIRLMGEVPLAPFLSGGIDSYAVLDSMVRARGGSGAVACTVGFDDPRYDERPEARRAAAACGADLREEVVRVEDMLDLQWHADVFDEPFSDSSAVPTWHVSRLARRHVTVALSGDGGDEDFGGYRRYLFDRRENALRRCLPPALWRLLGALYPKADFLPRWLRFKRTLQNLGCEPAAAYARSVCAVVPEELAQVLGPELRAAGDAPLLAVEDAYRSADAADPLGRAVAADLPTWLAGDILTKVDRASMAVSLEVRAPFLDHRLVEFAARVPATLKLRGGRTKAFLRAALASRLRADALRRRKRGFSVPLRAWCAGPLGDALERELPVLEGLLDLRALRERLRAHRRGVRDHGELLWGCLVLARFLWRWRR